MITLNHYIVLSIILFTIGVIGVIRRKNLLMIILSTEVMLNAVNLFLIATSYYYSDMKGQIVAFFIIAIAACEVAIGIALMMLWYKKTKSVEVSSLTSLKG